MFDTFFEMKQYDLAKLAAFWSLQQSLKFSRTIADIARSFANAMTIVFFVDDANDFLWLQQAALVQTVRTLFCDDLNLWSLTEVTKMYNALMILQ